MNEIYIVFHCRGSYDDYQEIAVKAFADNDAAELFAEELRERKKKFDVNMDKLRTIEQEWYKHNPWPAPPRGYPKALPSFPGPRKSWTAEQKEKLMQVNNYNEKVTTEFQEKNITHYAARSTITNEFKSTLTAHELEDIESMERESHWSVEAIPFQE